MKREVLKAFTVLWLMGMYIVMIATFMAAYQSPAKTVLVTINQFSEANLEFFMLLGALFLSAAGSLMLLIYIRRDFVTRMIRRFESAT
jgi:hypothetical protein